FARDVLEDGSGPLPLFTGTGAEMDLVGDIHGENYGTIKGEDGLVHYDINDYDETTTGRFDFDVCRLAISQFLAARERNDSLERAVQITLGTITGYAQALRRLLGKGKVGEPDIHEKAPSGCGPLDDLVSSAAAAKRSAFIQRLTEVKDGRRRMVR